MGTMGERPPGSWELTVSAGLDPATGRYRRVIRKIRTTSKRDATAALAALETSVANGQVSFDDPTLANLLDRWIEHITGPGRSATTLYHYCQYVDREIVPVLGAIRRSRLSTLEIDALYTRLRKRGLAGFARIGPSAGASSSATSPSWPPRRRSRSASNIRHPSPKFAR